MYSVTVYSAQYYKVLRFDLKTYRPCPESLSPVTAMPASPWDPETLRSLYEHGRYVSNFVLYNVPPAGGLRPCGGRLKILVLFRVLWRSKILSRAPKSAHLHTALLVLPVTNP